MMFTKLLQWVGQQYASGMTPINETEAISEPPQQNPEPPPPPTAREKHQWFREYAHSDAIRDDLNKGGHTRWARFAVDTEKGDIGNGIMKSHTEDVDNARRYNTTEKSRAALERDDQYHYQQLKKAANFLRRDRALWQDQYGEKKPPTITVTDDWPYADKGAMATRYLLQADQPENQIDYRDIRKWRGGKYLSENAAPPKPGLR